MIYHCIKTLMSNQTESTPYSTLGHRQTAVIEEK